MGKKWLFQISRMWTISLIAPFLYKLGLLLLWVWKRSVVVWYLRIGINTSFFESACRPFWVWYERKPCQVSCSRVWCQWRCFYVAKMCGTFSWEETKKTHSFCVAIQKRIVLYGDYNKKKNAPMAFNCLMSSYHRIKYASGDF